MTVYTFVIEGRDPLEQIGTVEKPPEFRPHIGDQLKISSRPETEWKVTRSIPSDNPSNVAVTYVVEDMRLVNLVREGGPGDFNQSFVTNAKFGNSAYRFRKSLY